MQIGTRDRAAGRASPPIDVLGCELVPAGAGQDLLRVTLTTKRSGPVRPADIRVVATDDDGQHVFAALPSLPGSRQATFTVGFAIPSQLAGTPLELQTGALQVALPAPVVRRLTPAVPAPRKHDDVLAAELRALDFATAAVRAESDRLELETALSRSRAALTETQAELARLQEFMPAPAIASGRPSRRTVLLGAGAAVCVAAAVIVIATAGGGHDKRPPAAAARPHAAAPVTRQTRLARRLGIPPTYLTLYQRAGRRYGLDWTMLAAVGDVETEHGRAALPGVRDGNNDRGASGPAQFLSGTWEDYGVDGDGDGIRNPYDPADAIPAMASYLRASGAPLDWTAALLTYNHSPAYAAAVQQRAAHYRHLVGR